MLVEDGNLSRRTKIEERRRVRCEVCDHSGDGDEDAQMAGVVGSSGVGGGW
jgi:hypothetical protein